MSEEMELPESWSSDKIGNVFFTTSGGTPSRKNPNYYIGSIPWVKSGELDKGLITQTEEYISTEAIENSSAKVFPKGTLLIALYGATIGKLGFLGVDAATNQAICGIFDNGNFSLQYTKYFLFHNRNKLIEQGAGGAQPNISQTILKELSIVIPPLAEQHRIVAKIEELFSSLDKAIESINTAKEQLKVYRQAVLKWAFEFSKLTPNKFLLSELSDRIQIGPFGSQLHKEDYIEGGIPLVNPMHIKNGRIVKDESYSITIEKRNSLPNYILKKGDIVMGRRGEMARCGLVTEKEDGWFCGTGSLFVRPKSSDVDSVFLYYQLSSEATKSYLENNAGGTTMANLNLKIVSGIPILLPPIDEQLKIISEIESRLSVCDKIEEGIENSLLQAEALRQSILKRAFEGKLVPQDPNDEPASKLIERIKAEREQSGGIRVKKEKKTRVMKEHKME